MSSQREVSQPTVSRRARMGWTVPLGRPASAPISTPYSSFEGSASRVRRTSWVGMVMRGVRFASMLVVYLDPRLNTRYSWRRRQHPDSGRGYGRGTGAEPAVGDATPVRAVR